MAGEGPIRFPRPDPGQWAGFEPPILAMMLASIAGFAARKRYWLPVAAEAEERLKRLRIYEPTRGAIMKKWTNNVRHALDRIEGRIVDDDEASNDGGA